MKDYLIQTIHHDMQGLVSAESPTKALEKYLSTRSFDFSNSSWAVNEIIETSPTYWYRARCKDGKYEIDNLNGKIYTGYRVDGMRSTTLAEMIKDAQQNMAGKGDPAGNKHIRLTCHICGDTVDCEMINYQIFGCAGWSRFVDGDPPALVHECPKHDEETTK